MYSEALEYYVYGAGGFGKEFLFLCRNSRERLIPTAFIDDFSTESVFCGLPVLKELPEEGAYFLAIANGNVKKRLYEKWPDSLATVPVIHEGIRPDASITVGAASVLCEGVRLTVDIQIGKAVLINLNATVGHDVVIEDFVSIMPGANISGNVYVGEGTLIGSGAVILPGIRIGRYCKIGAGAVVTKDIPDHSVAKGVPAKWG